MSFKSFTEIVVVAPADFVYLVLLAGLFFLSRIDVSELV
jgi:hypothetical protein